MGIERRINVENIRDCRVGVDQRACGLQNGGARSVELMVSMQEEQDVESLLQHWVWDVVFFTHMVHHVQETGDGEVNATTKPKGGRRLTIQYS